MPDKEIIKIGIDRELEVLEIALTAKVTRTAITLEEYINIRLTQGVTKQVIEADLLKDLEEGGRIFGEFKNALRPTFFGSLRRFRDVGELAELGLEGKWRWVAVLINTCPDCLERHGQIKTWNEWEEEGLPRANATVCEQHCRCMLLPEKVTELAPIYRG